MVSPVNLKKGNDSFSQHLLFSIKDTDGCFIVGEVFPQGNRLKGDDMGKISFVLVEHKDMEDIVNSGWMTPAGHLANAFQNLEWADLPRVESFMLDESHNSPVSNSLRKT